MTKQKLSGVLFILFPLLIQIPFSILAAKFQYPDILRLPPGEILTKFSDGGNFLILTWYFYAAFIFVFLFATLTYKSVSGNDRLEKTLKVIGVTSAVVQMLGLLRWTFLVPFLADAYKKASGVDSKLLIETIFTAQHNFLGLGMGEHLGQVTLIIFTVLMIHDQKVFGRLHNLLGYASAGFLAAGLSEHYSVVFNFNPGVLAHGALVGFILWSVWLIWMGIKLIRGS